MCMCTCNLTDMLAQSCSWGLQAQGMHEGTYICIHLFHPLLCYAVFPIVALHDPHSLYSQMDHHVMIHHHPVLQ